MVRHIFQCHARTGEVSCALVRADIAETISAADHLLLVTENPRHRAILENYRRHAILEITGEWEAIFAPDMMVEEPVYNFNITGLDGVVAIGAEAVQDIYRTLAETQTCVMLVENEQPWINDWGFASDSNFVTFERGHDLLEKGFKVDDPAGYYREIQHFVMVWPYDEHARVSSASSISSLTSRVARVWCTRQPRSAAAAPNAGHCHRSDTGVGADHDSGSGVRTE